MRKQLQAEYGVADLQQAIDAELIERTLLENQVNVFTKSISTIRQRATEFKAAVTSLRDEISYISAGAPDQVPSLYRAEVSCFIDRRSERKCFEKDGHRTTPAHFKLTCVRISDD